MRINQIDFELLRSFCVLAEERHFGRAAKRLNISQPPLSRRIQRLEELLGCKLLERTQRRVELTAAGLVFMTEADVSIFMRRELANGKTVVLRKPVDEQQILDVISHFVDADIDTAWRNAM